MEIKEIKCNSLDEFLNIIFIASATNYVCVYIAELSDEYYFDISRGRNIVRVFYCNDDRVTGLDLNDMFKELQNKLSDKGVTSYIEKERNRAYLRVLFPELEGRVEKYKKSQGLLSF